LEGSTRRKFLPGKGLQTSKTRKSEKTRKKVSFFSGGPPVFLPKRAIFLNGKM